MPVSYHAGMLPASCKRGLRDIPLFDFSVLDNEAFSNLLLFGDDKLNIVSNRMILEATISFIEKTKRLH